MGQYTCFQWISSDREVALVQIFMGLFPVCLACLIKACFAARSAVFISEFIPMRKDKFVRSAAMPSELSMLRQDILRRIQHGMINLASLWTKPIQD